MASLRNVLLTTSSKEGHEKHTNQTPTYYATGLGHSTGPGQILSRQLSHGHQDLLLVQYGPVAPVDGVGLADLSKDSRRYLGGASAFRGIEVDVVETELLREAGLPLVAVHQTPGDIATDINTILDGVQHRGEVQVVVVHPGIVLQAAAITDSVLGDDNLGGIVLAVYPHQQIVHALGIDLEEGWRKTEYNPLVSGVHSTCALRHLFKSHPLLIPGLSSLLGKP